MACPLYDNIDNNCICRMSRSGHNGIIILISSTLLSDGITIKKYCWLYNFISVSSKWEMSKSYNNHHMKMLWMVGEDSLIKLWQVVIKLLMRIRIEVKSVRREKMTKLEKEVSKIVIEIWLRSEPNERRLVKWNE